MVRATPAPAARDDPGDHEVDTPLSTDAPAAKRHRGTELHSAADAKSISATVLLASGGPHPHCALPGCYAPVKNLLMQYRHQLQCVRHAAVRQD